MSVINWKIILYVLLAFVCLGGIVYFLGWMLASASLASGYCIPRGGFQLFHDEFRCRQPYLALIGMIVSFVAFVFSVYRAFKSKKPRQLGEKASQ